MGTIWNALRWCWAQVFYYRTYARCLCGRVCFPHDVEQHTTNCPVVLGRMDAMGSRWRQWDGQR